MAAGELKAVVCTSTLDLGIDWGAVDLVINIGAPKGASRLTQRIGRANHRLDEPSRALLVPSNRFEVLECRAAVDAANEGAQDTAVAREGALDVLVPAHPRHGLRRTFRCRRPLRRDHLGRALCRGRSDDLRSGAGLCRQRRLRARRLRSLRQDQANQGWAVARRQRAGGADLSDERRHHRRGDGAEGAPRAGPRPPERRALYRPARTRRPGARRAGGRLPRVADARRYLPLRRRDPGAAGHRRERGAGVALGRRHAARALLRRRQVPALHLSGEPRARPAGDAGKLEHPADAGGRMAGHAGRPIRPAAAGRPAGRDVSARRAATTSCATPSRDGWLTRRSACC